MVFEAIHCSLLYNDCHSNFEMKKTELYSHYSLYFKIKVLSVHIVILKCASFVVDFYHRVNFKYLVLSVGSYFEIHLCFGSFSLV